MTDKEIVKRAKDAEKRTRFGELVYSPVSNGVNSAYGIGFIEGMVEYRNSLQEEPKQKFKIGDRIKFKGVYNEDVVRTITDIQKYDDGSCRYIFADGSIHSISDDKIELVEEHVSEDLEEYSALIADELPQGIALTSNGEFDIASVRKFIIDACKFGANWQREKDESTTEDLDKYINELSKQFPEVSFAKLSRIAVRVAKWQREQMIAKAIDAEVLENYDGKVIKYDDTILDEKLSGCKVFDKVKVIVIKED